MADQISLALFKEVGVDVKSSPPIETIVGWNVPQLYFLQLAEGRGSLGQPFCPG